MDARERVLRDASTSLATFIASDPTAQALIVETPDLPTRGGYAAIAEAAAAHGGMAFLRLEKRRRLAQIAAFDLCGEVSLEEVAAALSNLAGAWLEVALSHLHAPEGMAVIGMGKLGGRELNYASDIDLIYVTEEDLPGATKAASSLSAELGRPSPQGQSFRIDLNLRPEGRSGALVRSVDGCIEYYTRWAQPWEHQALIKAGLVAGNVSVGTEFVDRTRPLVYPSDVSPERIASIRRMKERIESHAARSLRYRKPDAADVKLGPGGIRDIEFSVQLLQLVHGGSDDLVRRPNTLEAIAALAAGGYVAEDDGIALSEAYRWLRSVEHRLQLWQERQVHRLPDKESDRARIARSMGFRDTVDRSVAANFDAAHRRILSDVRSRFEKLFYRPMIESLADATGTRLSEEALRERLRVLGFRDAERAARNLGKLVSGISRRAVLLRLLTPAMLRFLARTPLPDGGLLAFLRLSERLEERPAMLGKFRDNPPGLEFLAAVLGSGRVLGELLEHVPEELATIAAHGMGPAADVSDRVLKDRDRLVDEAQASLAWREPEGRLQGLRRFKRRAMVGVALADLGGEIDTTDIGRGLAHLADACLEAALEGVQGSFAVIGMGKLGGRELNYSSDIDVVLVHDMDPSLAVTVGEGLVRAVGDVTPEGRTWRIDLGLRPEGKDGALVRSIDSSLEYYHRWAQPWEHLALIKARVVAGDHRLGQRLVDGTRSLAWPETPPPGAIGEIRHLKARMEKERIRRGTDARLNIKLGPGGISDIEFATQLLQLQNAHRLPALRVTGTMEALEAAAKVGVLPIDDASILIDALRFLTTLRNRMFFMTGHPVDVLPSKLEDLEALGVALGFSYQPLQELQEAHLRTTRRARRVAEKLIYG
ncbi:MAG: bifunctional [glutamine synthetase] adenylyltransferase/[glutamine synthetase]-adenylyl-L-tyrosine phosphorylase [Actinomycetota bacterium]|nr:bifunctional [glutamine synthetase] adenylyltransferase/[glutamine synthetase]-adenylyl-L-tyrosine phosphorylase [Actinomycetota bacterium]